MEHARLTLVSATDYLTMEQASATRHEFVAGRVETLRAYAIVAVDERRVEVCRLEPGAEWHHYIYSGEEVVAFDSASVTLPLADIYRGVVLQSPGAEH